MVQRFVFVVLLAFALVVAVGTATTSANHGDAHGGCIECGGGGGGGSDQGSGGGGGGRVVVGDSSSTVGGGGGGGSDQGGGSGWGNRVCYTYQGGQQYCEIGGQGGGGN